MADSDYIFQLEQVEEALARDPTNADLQRLQADLKDLIGLMGLAAAAPAKPKPKETKLQQQLQPATATSSTTTTAQAKRSFEDSDNGGNDNDNGDYEQASDIVASRWVKGQTVLAKYNKDQKMYEAVVDSVPSKASPFYAVIFKGYTSREKVAIEDIRDFDPTQVAKPLAAVTGGAANRRNTVPKAVVAAFSNGTDRASKRKKNNLEYHEAIKQKEEEQSTKQNAWQKFATGGKKAALKTTAPLKKTSMFASPDDPNAKVGVVGSGKGMSNIVQRGKHVYERTG
ncbi:UNVERIFIED_CONTAM: hypothetical protein HDU68_004713 [Siphonaria sp. JEL0065]|nr:hypothetical protein HDU68_004713 [Siphonaria sp. JEL0065]